MIVKIFYDLETTGTDPKKNSIHQIAGLVEIDDQVVEDFNILTRPHPKAQIDDGALRVTGKTLEEINSYQSMDMAHKEFKALVAKYIDPYNPKSKAWNIGFNNRGFDDVFLRAWFMQNEDPYIGSLFWTDTIDVMCLASEYLINRRADMPSFKLSRVAMELGLEVDKSKLHDAGYDGQLTRGVYRIVTGREVEI